MAIRGRGSFSAEAAAPAGQEAPKATAQGVHNAPKPRAVGEDFSDSEAERLQPSAAWSASGIVVAVGPASSLIDPARAYGYRHLS